MLSLGPGSACDVCLEPFGTELKAPCSISCGHVFCVNCLQHIARPTCPLCRTPFQARHTVKLHVDLDNIRALASSDGVPPPANSDEGARQLHKRITSVASEGATEAQTTQLTEECKAFLSTVPKTMYSELRTAYRMLYYMCQVKRNFVEQGRTVNQLARNASTVSQDMDRLKASIEALKLEKRNWEQAWQSVSAEKDDLSSECQRLHEQLDNAQAQILLVTEQNETAQIQLVLLNEELQRLRSQPEFSSSDGDFSSLDGDSPTELPSDFPPAIDSDKDWEEPGLGFHSDNEDLAVPFLTPWNAHSGLSELKSLPEPDLSEPPVPVRVFCGAAGCPHSCDCMPFQLFSPGSRQAAAAASEPGSRQEQPPAGLSALFMQDRARSRSRSPAYPRSRSLSRTPSPSNLATSSFLAADPPHPMSASINIPPNAHPHQEMRGQLKDLLRDPPMSSSLPNMTFARYGASSPLHPSSSKERLVPTVPLHLHQPMVNQSRHPSPLHGSSPLADPRPPLYRTSSSGSSVTKESGKEQRRMERAAAAAATAPSMRISPPLVTPHPLTQSSIPSSGSSPPSRARPAPEPSTSMLTASMPRPQNGSPSPPKQSSSRPLSHSHPSSTTPPSAYGPPLVANPPTPPPQPQPPRTLNARAEPKPTSPTSQSIPRSHAPPSTSATTIRPPQSYPAPSAPHVSAPSVAVDSRSIYASSSSRARQSETVGASVSRGSSKRLLPAMTTAQNVLQA